MRELKGLSFRVAKGMEAWNDADVGGWVPMKYGVFKQFDLNYCNGGLPTTIQLDIKLKGVGDGSTRTSLGIEVA